MPHPVDYTLHHGLDIEETRVNTTCTDAKVEIEITIRPKDANTAGVVVLTLKKTCPAHRDIDLHANDNATIHPELPQKRAETPKTQAVISRWLAQSSLDQSPTSEDAPPPFPGSPPPEIADAASTGTSKTEPPDMYLPWEVQQHLNQLWLTGRMPWPFMPPTREKSSWLPAPIPQVPSAAVKEVIASKRGAGDLDEGDENGRDMPSKRQTK
ncbi:hypothetical protein NEOLEDRAFT_1178789 [Neolentinus lepideus HHB14362 ss-1]|uniref:Uncharacterized protein n=1 Tax=Neolentinus lepideus HHB14362 ss-1 TaxID=1314782 RepID=A0A165SEG9_9AGAM|nr:hypothetical protein NEOLEDRAFT_1178789 [Neolentinus lepideus HHB14362 ss-1]